MECLKEDVLASQDEQDISPNEQRKPHFTELSDNVREIRNDNHSQDSRAHGNPPPQPYQVVGGQSVYMQNQPPPRPVEASRTPAMQLRYYEDDSNSELTRPDGFAPNFNTKQIRNRFIRKVYLLLTVLLLYTAGVIALVVSVSRIRMFFFRYWWVGLTCSLLFMVFYITLVCVESARKNFPLNFILLCICVSITFFASIGFAAAAVYYSTDLILYSAAITAGLCVLITLLACQPWIDVTGCGGLICLLMVAVMVFGSVVMIISFTIGVSRVLFLVYSGIVAFVVCVYFLFITQLILGGKRYELSPEEYILAVIILYTEIMHLFLLVLQILSGGRR